MSPLEGKVAVVTGGGRGMGRAIAGALAAEGADVAIVDRSQDGLAAVCADVEAHGRRALPVLADLTDFDALPAVFASIAEHFDGFDILMNNAGVSPSCPALETTEEIWDASMDLNAKALFLCAREAGRHFRQRGRPGRIINTCSTYGLTVEPGLAVYCASKGAVLQITRALAAEWAAWGINVNAIAPTLIETQMTRELFGDAAYMDAFMRRIPAGALPRPTDVADAVVFLAGPRSDHVHGHMLVVDGGELTL